MKAADDAEGGTTDYADGTDGEMGWCGRFPSYLCDQCYLWFKRLWNPRRQEGETTDYTDYTDGELEIAGFLPLIRVIRVIRGPSFRGLKVGSAR